MVPLRDGRDTVEMIESQKVELEALRRHLTLQGVALDTLSADIVAVEAAQSRERLAWQGDLHKLKELNKKLSSPWAVGVFAGYDPFQSDCVFGIGITYSFVRF